ncbi:MAG TPA: Dyp-type peroxidase [Candidatus Acidoferrales bacterium]|nr:Dyp-type peroxidase [Candidatus Acidoferrales bacterium]
MLDRVQAGILAPPPRLARFLAFSLKPRAPFDETLKALREYADGAKLVVGLGHPLVLALKRQIEGLRPFPSSFGSGLAVPSTQAALWCWFRGNDRGELLHASRRISDMVSLGFTVEAIIDAFQYDTGRDLTGYEDGTENPKGEKAIAAAIVQGRGEELNGSSFVAVQQWLHDFESFERLSPMEQDDSVGRGKSDNEELPDAPPSAHVKRTAQESFEPEAFVLRRSMPWAEGARGGLVFVAFGKSLDAFEAQLRRMVGAEDGITDALFQYTRPIAGSYFWCPPLRNGRLDLRALGIA